MPTSTRSKKETQMLLSSYPASFERSIRKGRGASSINNNPCSSLVSRQPPSTQTPASPTNTPSPPSTEDTPPSTDIFHPTSIDTSVRTSIDTEPRDMVATLILGAVFPEPNTDATCLGKIFHEEITPASGFQVPASRFRVPASRFRVPALGSGCCLQLPASRTSDLSCLRINGNLPLIRGVEDIQLQSSAILQPPRQGFAPRRPSSPTCLQPMNPCDYYQPEEDVCSLQHVYNSTYWFRPQSPAHQQGPSMLTEAHQHIVLTAAYPQRPPPKRPISPAATKAPTTYTGSYQYGSILRAGSPGLSTIEAREYTQRHVSFLLSFHRAEHGSLVHKNTLTVWR
ncbi:hypothetical protein DY000_02040949 [Brassica cretica]|uniref:Uncharacterized protein n=1 Tax=Brassica cretica TaxID=69181 RepID=A0ABQ7B769_BRACR|nr:hypothetical protein DY000_02040949 [Brassica cretica]